MEAEVAVVASVAATDPREVTAPREATAPTEVIEVTEVTAEAAAVASVVAAVAEVPEPKVARPPLLLLRNDHLCEQPIRPSLSYDSLESIFLINIYTKSTVSYFFDLY